MIDSLNISWNNRKSIIVFSIIILMVTVLEIWAVNRLATLGEQINKLEMNKNALVLDNQILNSKIAEKSSLLAVEKQTQSFGFTKISKLQYLAPSGLALK